MDNTSRKAIMPGQLEYRVQQFPQDRYRFEKANHLYGNLALPSYVHGYTLAIEYMYNWFKNKFPKDFFRGGIYIDGKHVLDDYRRLNEFASKNIVKGENPRARMAPIVEYDFDRDYTDTYHGPIELYLRRSKFEDAFFKDYDRDMFLGFVPRALRMNVGYKVRVNTRSQQLDLFNRMELGFRNGATQSENLSVDFHVPKEIMLDIAKKAGFKIKDGEVVDIVDYLAYLNSHSDLTFLFKLRAINLKAEFFIRVNNVYTHIAVRDKLQLDDGERDGKLDFNFGIEMQAILTMPIPHYFAYYSADDITMGIPIVDNPDAVAIYSINVLEIPKVDEHGWLQGAITDYKTDPGEEEIDLTPIIGGDNPLSRAITQDFTNGVSPSHFINIRIYRDDDTYRLVKFVMDWEHKKIIFAQPEDERVLHIVIYYDREYIAELEMAQEHLYRNVHRVETTKPFKDPNIDTTFRGDREEAEYEAEMAKKKQAKKEWLEDMKASEQ